MAAAKIGTDRQVCNSDLRFTIKNGTRVSVHGYLKDAPTLAMVTPMEGPHAGQWGIVGGDDLHECPPKTTPAPKGSGEKRASVSCAKVRENMTAGESREDIAREMAISRAQVDACMSKTSPQHHGQ
jgi:hypothetical protein